GDVLAVGGRLEADGPVGVGGDVELLPGGGRGAVGDQRGVTTGLGGDELAVGVGREVHRTADRDDRWRGVTRVGVAVRAVRDHPGAESPPAALFATTATV